MALLSLQLRDFVIVDTLNIDFNTGFTALTGETGAGKSILIDALQLLLGARADASVVRQGCERSEMSAVFDVSERAATWLEEAGFDAEEHVILRRQITAGSNSNCDSSTDAAQKTVKSAAKSRAWINGSPATATQLRALGDLLVDIHGQHAWTQLAKPEAVRTLLDDWAGLNLQPLRLAYHAWQTAKKAIQKATEDAATNTERRERLQWQIDEVQALAPQAGEWETLEAEHQVQSSAQDVLHACAQAMALLDSDGTVLGSARIDGGGSDGGALSLIDSASTAVTAFAHTVPQMQAVQQQLQQCMVEVQDANRQLRALRDSIVPDEERLAFLDTRVSQWLSLARRYRCEPDALPQLLQSWQQELLDLQTSSDLDALREQADAAQELLRQQAASVTSARAAAGASLSDKVTAIMQDLGMAGGRFVVDLQTLEQPAAHGMENVEFLLAGHPGAEPAAVRKIASGGELSRIALAIAVCTSQGKSIPTLIFDEVDAGIGGTVAATVGELMHTLGTKQQVLTVTHLAQVAAHAHQQHRIRKVSQNGHTNSSLELLHYTQRVEEIARMLGGSADDTASMEHAKAMLDAQQTR